MNTRRRRSMHFKYYALLACLGACILTKYLTPHNEPLTTRPTSTEVLPEPAPLSAPANNTEIHRKSTRAQTASTITPTDSGLSASTRYSATTNTPALLHNVDVVAHRVSNTTKPHLFKHEYLVLTDFTYPLLKVTELRTTQQGAPDDIVSEQVVMVADHMIVRLKPNTPSGHLDSINKKYGASIRKALLAPNTFLVEFENTDLDRLEDIMTAYEHETASIAYAEPDYVMFTTATFPDDTLFTKLFGLHNISDTDIDAAEAWDLSTGSDAVLVGVIDSGFDFDHPDLAPNIWHNEGERGLDTNGHDKRSNGIDDDGNGFVDDHRGWDFIDNDNDPVDEYFHGTHVAGTIGAAGNNGRGVAGVNWRVKMMALRIISATGAAAVSLATDALHYGAPFGMRVTCNSYGGSGYSQTLYDAIEFANSSNMLFVAAAGNSGTDNDTTPHYPSSYTNENVIAVAATDTSDNRYYISNYGATSVDLGALGWFVWSTVPGGEYNFSFGTSMAAPHVAGAAALLWAIARDASNLAIRDALFAGVDPLPALAGITATGGRLNLFNAIHEIGMHVATSDPGEGDIVFTALKDFAVHFSAPYTPATIDASDLTVNGIPANSYSLTDSNTVTFHYTTSPLADEGAHIMAMPAAAVTRLADGVSLGAWSTTFRYDALALQVSSASPPDGATVTLPLHQVTLDFNEAIDVSTVGKDDLIVSQGMVTNAEAVDTDTVTFSLANVHSEAMLNIEIPEGSILDVQGAPIVPYQSTYRLDVATYPVINPLREAPPLGSLIYTSSVSAELSLATDEDTFTLALDEGDTLTIVAMPDAFLHPVVELISPSNALLASSAAQANGEHAILQSVTLDASGVYAIRIRSVGQQSQGFYQLAVMVNAAEELEEHGGAENNMASSAQPMDASFVALPGGGSRGAVLGKLYPPEGAPILEETFEQGTLGPAWTTFSSNTTGRIQVTGDYGAGEGYKALLMDQFPEGELMYNEAVWTVDLTEATNAWLRFSHATWQDERFGFNGPFVDKIYGDGVAMSADGFIWHPVWSARAQPAGEWISYAIDISAIAATSGISLGPNMRFKFQQTDDLALPYDGMGWDDIAITIPTSDEDWYSVDLEANDAVTLAVDHRGPASVTFDLYHTNGTQLSSSSSSVYNVRSRIERFSAPYSGRYYVRLTGHGAYSLTIARHATFDMEPNNALSSAQPFDTETLFGHLIAAPAPLPAEVEPNDDGEVGGLPLDLIFANDLSGSFTSTGGGYFAEVTGTIAKGFDKDWDFFKIFAAPGDVVSANMRGAGSGGGTINDPYLRLFDRDGNELAAIDDGGISTDALLIYSNFNYSGAYYVVADSDIVWLGTYTLSVSITTPVLAGPDEIDTFEKAFSAGDRIKIQTYTPADAPHALTSDLDPLVEVFNPSGVSVASNDNGSADGKNAALVYEAVTTGVHSFQTRAKAGSGPYLLTVELEPLLLSLPTESVEDGGTLTGAGTVTIESVLGYDLTVDLSSDDTSELAVPPTAVITAGLTSATFDIALVDDFILDGTKQVTVTASATGFANDESPFSVHDSEATALTLSIPSTATEGVGTLAGQGRVNLANPAQDLMAVALLSSDTTELMVPPWATLSPGQTTTTFDITIVDDQLIDGLQSVQISTAVTNWINDSASINVADNDARALSLGGPTQVVEGQGTLLAVGAISIPGTLPADLSVTLSSDDASEITVPSSVIIPAGSTSTLFNITVEDDVLADGAQNVQLSATAPTFSSASHMLTAFDNEFHHLSIDPIPSPQARATPFGVTVSARAIDDGIILNYASTSSVFARGTKGVPLELGSTNELAFQAGVWSGSLQIDDVDTAVVLTLNGGQGHIVQSNPFDVLGAICDISPVHLSNTFVRANLSNTRQLTVANTGNQPLNYTMSTDALTTAVYRSEHPISPEGDQTSWARIGDLDGDGDEDVVGVNINTHLVLWWENPHPSNGPWVEHVIRSNFSQTTYAHVADINNDGDLDVIACSFFSDTINWWENDGGTGTSWIEHNIATNYDAPRRAIALDLDQDGHVDVLTAAQNDDEITWWRNTTGAGTAWVRNTVDATFDGVSDVDAVDFDGDGDIDILGTAATADEVAWWENMNSNGTSWTKHSVDTNFNGANAIHAVDLDMDGDTDVIAGSSIYPSSGRLEWWVNLDGSGMNWSNRLIRSFFPHVGDITTSDLDEDGDLDVLGASSSLGLAWWENTDGAMSLPIREVDWNYSGARSIEPHDVDQDGDLDVVGGSTTRGIALFKNNRVADWFTPRDAAGSIAANTETNILLSFNGVGFLPGEHVESALVIQCNDALSPSNEIRIHMAILDTLPPPVLAAEPMYTLGTSNRVDWDNIPDADTYWVEAALVTNIPAVTNSGWIAAETFTFSALADGTQYYYRAKAGMTGSSGTIESVWSPWVSSLQLHHDGDADLDGIPNHWEDQYGYDPQSPTDGSIDFDLDGMNTRAEYMSGTDPFDFYSTLEILEVIYDGTLATIHWKGGTSARQLITVQEDLISGTPTMLFTNQPPTAVTNSFQYLTPHKRGYYRIQVEQP